MSNINHGDKRSFIFKNAHRCIIEAESESKNQRQKTAIEKKKKIFSTEPSTNLP